MDAIPECRAIARGGATLAIADAETDQAALRASRRQRDDVDDAVDRVRAPDARSRPADHLDAGHVLQHHVLAFPEYAREKRRVDRAPVDEDEHLVGQEVVEAARADRVLGRVGTRDVQVGSEPQRLAEGGRAGAMDVLGGNDIDGARDVGKPLAASRDRGHDDGTELLQAQAGKVLRRRCLREPISAAAASVIPGQVRAEGSGRGFGAEGHGRQHQGKCARQKSAALPASAASRARVLVATSLRACFCHLSNR